jgi:ketosteroid isomerase-like protein
MRSLLLLWTMKMASAQAAPIDAVLDADRAFAAAAKQKGAGAAFVEFAALDAIMFRQGVGPVKGLAAIGQVFPTPETATAAWEPEGGEIAASGDLAYTWGYFAWTAISGPNVGKPPVTGNYVSIWRKQPDGRWKWVIDLGITGPPKSP